MEARKLRLGSYVKCNRGKYMEIASLNRSHIFLDWPGNDGLMFESKEKYIEPIDITEDLLELLDFEKRTIGDYECWEKDIQSYTVSLEYDMSNTPGREWGLHIDNPRHETIASMDIQHLHSLQMILEDFDIPFDLDRNYLKKMITSKKQFTSSSSLKSEI